MRTPTPVFKYPTNVIEVHADGLNRVLELNQLIYHSPHQTQLVRPSSDNTVHIEYGESTKIFQLEDIIQEWMRMKELF